MRPRLKTLLLLSTPLVVIVASATVSQYIWRENGLRSLQAVNQQRVQLVANAVKSEISRQDHLPLVLSLDADVRRALERSNDKAEAERLYRKLQRIGLEADTRALYVVAANGVVISSNDWQSPDNLVGRNLLDRPYFTQAVDTGKSSYLGVEPEINRVRYYLAEAVRDPVLLGVTVVRIEFDTLETAWQRAGERVLITDSRGVVFLASEPGYKYRPLGSIVEREERGADPAHYPESKLAPIQFDILERRGSEAIIRTRALGEDASYLHQSMLLPEYGWTIHRLTELSSIDADQRDGAIIGGAISALLMLILFYLMQRQRAYVAAREAGARLQSQVAERTRELQTVNSSLQSEIDERRRTEQRLRAAQNELIQAGKLAALGQMSAAIAHEINQPLAAMRTFMASTKIFLQRGETAKVIRNLDLVNDLAERMAKITAHLKTFARRNDPGKPEPVLVERALEGALFLLESQTKSTRVRFDKEIQPNVWINGYPVQLEQVILNLIHNALDAVATTDNACIRIQVRADSDLVTIAVGDNGPGIPPDTLHRIFDPFFTTKPVGKGLGLGLSITYGIVQDLGGHMRAANRDDGGAELVIELPRAGAQIAREDVAQHA